MDAEMDLGRCVGILPVEGLADPLADSAAVFVIGLGQHHDDLGCAAPGEHISLAQAANQQLLQVIHSSVQTSPGKALPVLPVDG